MCKIADQVTDQESVKRCWQSTNIMFDIDLLCPVSEAGMLGEIVVMVVYL